MTGLEQLSGLKRLAQKFKGIGLLLQQGQDLIGTGRHHHHRDTAEMGMFLKTSKDLNAIHFRHLAVQQNQIGSMALHLLQPFKTIAGFDNISRAWQHSPQTGTHRSTIVNDENFCFLIHSVDTQWMNHADPR